MVFAEKINSSAVLMYDSRSVFVYDFLFFGVFWCFLVFLHGFL